MKPLRLVTFVALFGIGATGARAQAWLTNNLVAHYLFNGTAADTSGNGNNGVLTGAYYGTNRFGITGKSIVFTGNTNFFAATNFPLVNSTFTYSAWVKVSGASTAPGDNNLQSFGCLGTSPANIWNCCLDDDNGGYNLWDARNGTWTTDGGDFTTTSNWVQVIITYNATNNSEWQYINGKPVGSRGVSLPITDNGSRNFVIGVCDAAEGQQFIGQVDDVRLYKVALSSNQVTQLYEFEANTSPAALGTAVLAYDFVVYVNLTYGGSGYTNVPTVQFIGGGGSGAQAVAVVSNGVVTAVNVLDAGYGYTNAPLVVIGPPYVTTPVLNIAPATLLTFSSLTTGTNYQLQQLVTGIWTNPQSAFNATGTVYTQAVAGAAGSGNYRLVRTPVPAQATATPVVVNGFVVGATLTSGGSGYVTNPAVHIIGGGGVNASVLAKISGGGVVTNLTIASPGSGYTGTPTLVIAAPPVSAILPAVSPMVQLNSSALTPYVSYQIQSIPGVGGIWTNWNGGAFSPTGTISSQILSATNSTGFFRLRAN